MATLQDYQQMLPADYRLQKELGEGGFAQTLLARRGPEQTPCVLKVLSLRRSQDWKAVELFEREAKVMRHLDHPGIPDFYDSFSLSQAQETFFFLVQEYLPGQNLQQWISDGKRFTEAQVMAMARQLCEILIYLQGFSPPVIHRDIKPSNILRDQAGRVWLIDFGAVKDSLQQVQGRGSTVVGTFGYMPMEQYEGRAQPASDIYALGMSLLYALSGTEPVQMKKKGLKTDFRQHLQISEGLARILDRMIEPDVVLRYPDARAVLADLETLSRRPAPGQHVPQASQRNAMLGIALLIIAGGLGLTWQEYKRSPAAAPASKALLPLSQSNRFPAPWQPAGSNLPERVQALHSQNQTLWLSDGSHVYALQQGQLQQWDAETLLGDTTYLGFQLSSDGGSGIYALGKSSKGNFGLNQITPAKQARIPLPGAGPFEALALHKGQLLLANGGRLWRYTPATGQWQLLASMPARYSRQPTIRKLLVHQDQLWLAADGGLWQLKNNSLISRWQGQAFINHLAAGPDGLIWLGSSEGLSVFEPDKNNARQVLQQAEVEALAVDAANGVWVGTRDSGLLHWLPDSQRWQALGWREGLPDDHVKALAVQNETLWIALDSDTPHQASLSRLKAQLAQGFQLPEIAAQRYPDACTAAARNAPGGGVQLRSFRGKAHVFFDGELVCPQGQAAMNPAGTAAFYDYQQGVVRSSSSTGNEVLGRPPGISPYTTVREMLVDPSGHVWLSYYTNGVFRHAGSWQRINTPEDFQPVFAASGDRVWLGRNSSVGPQLIRYQNQQLKNLTLHERYLTVQQVLGRPDGGAAIASTLGLFVMDAADQIQTFNSGTGLPADYIWRMTQTPEGFWLSVGKGLSWLSWPGGKTRQITSREGLFSDRIRYLAVDGQQRLWLQNQHREVAVYRQDDLR